LEPLASGRAARTATPDVRRALLQLADDVAGIRDDEQPKDVLRKDVQVHRAIYRAAGNAHLEDILIGLDAHATRIWSLFIDRLPQIALHVREHEALLRAIVDGDEETASELTLAHVDGFERAVRSLL
jgi:DNA-binding GntR family transcriptional regulator